MKRKLLLNLFLGCILIISCNDAVDSNFICQEFGEYLGEFRLTDEANTFWSYSANQKRIYIDSLGNEITLQEFGAYNEGISESVVRTVCAPPDWNQQEVDYVNLEGKDVQYRDGQGNNYIRLILTTRLVAITDTSETFMDIMSINTPYSYFNFAASDRGNSEDVPDYYKIEYLETLTDTTLLGHDFQNLYYDTIYEFPTFFNKTEGVVAFHDWNGTLWVLDRIE